jgi:hypothetical protein
MFKKVFLPLLLLLPTMALPNMASEGFERFMNHYFVETGTYLGSGIRFALRAGFPEIHSVEISPELAKNAKAMFAPFPQVHIWEGNSGTMLWDVIKDLDKPITFWLDGHMGAPNPHGKATPLLEELEQIKQHPIKNHTIIIDDMHCCGTALFDFITKEMIMHKIWTINPQYTIYFVPGGDAGEYKENIMVAQVK